MPKAKSAKDLVKGSIATGGVMTDMFRCVCGSKYLMDRRVDVPVRIRDWYDGVEVIEGHCPTCMADLYARHEALLNKNDPMIYDPLGDYISRVEYVDHMGSDTSVVRAARVSYQGDSDKPKKGDAKLIRYLAENDHGTPFEHTAITIHVVAPIFVVRQWHRHRVGFSYNEVSRRYTNDLVQVYEPNEFRKQNESGNRQGSSESTEIDQASYLVGYQASVENVVNLYQRMVESGVANEQARMILPQSLYTRMYVTGNLRSFAHFFRLRADDHAQMEIRVYAEAIGKLLSILYPVSWNALTEGGTGK